MRGWQRTGLALLLVCAWHHTVLSAEQPASGYEAAFKEADLYYRDPARTRELAIKKFEAARSLAPDDPRNLAIDYAIGLMWISDFAFDSGERPDLRRFQQHVEMMGQRYKDRTNDIRMTYLVSCLEDEVAPVLASKGQSAGETTSKEEQEIIQRKLAFLREGKDKVVVPSDSPLQLAFLVRGELCALANSYIRRARTPEEKIRRLDELIDELRKDGRTHIYVAEIQDRKKRLLDSSNEKDAEEGFIEEEDSETVLLSAHRATPAPVLPPAETVLSTTQGTERSSLRSVATIAAVAVIALAVATVLLLRARAAGRKQTMRHQKISADSSGQNRCAE
jgi:hypothetical protein